MYSVSFNFIMLLFVCLLIWKFDFILQMHNLLELIKKEQNIYNIVFHELIRQVSCSYDCQHNYLSKKKFLLCLFILPKVVIHFLDAYI